MNQNLIKQRLMTLNKSQAWLASEIGMSSTYINHLTSGRVKNPTIQTVLRLAKALGCKVEDLYSPNGQPDKNEDYI